MEVSGRVFLSQLDRAENANEALGEYLLDRSKGITLRIDGREKHYVDTSFNKNKPKNKELDEALDKVKQRLAKINVKLDFE